MRTKQKSAFADRKMLGRAIKDSFAKLSPKTQAKNPVMFLVFVSAILTSILWVVSLFGLKDAPSGYTLAIRGFLWSFGAFGLPCYLPTLPRPLQKAVVKHRQILSGHPEKMWTHIKFPPYRRRKA